MRPIWVWGKQMEDEPERVTIHLQLGVYMFSGSGMSNCPDHAQSVGVDLLMDDDIPFDVDRPLSPFGIAYDGSYLYITSTNAGGSVYRVNPFVAPKDRVFQQLASSLGALRLLDVDNGDLFVTDVDKDCVYEILSTDLKAAPYNSSPINLGKQLICGGEAS